MSTTASPGRAAALGRIPLFLLFVCLWNLLSGQPFPFAALAAERDYHHVVLLGDPHIPGKEYRQKVAVLERINTWDDVDLVVALGDLCADFGTQEEYDRVKGFFGILKKPFCPITGNHDYMYDDFKDSSGRYMVAYSGKKEMKLKRFMDIFNIPEVYYARQLGGYLLLFLSADETGSTNLAQMSGKQLYWLRNQLGQFRNLPTIIFFHAPLRGTLLKFNRYAETDSFVAQPEEEIREILRSNPQVFLWAAGHLHVSPTNESFRSDINVYEKRVTTIHTTDMNRQRIPTNSLYLYRDRVVVRTYDHYRATWIDHLDRRIDLPR